MRRRAVPVVLGAVLAIVAITCLWKWTPLADVVAPEKLAEHLRQVQQFPAAPVWFVALYVVGGLVVAPVLALIIAVAILFPPLVAVGISWVGVLLSATVLYFLGRRFGNWLNPRLGPAVPRVRQFLDERGVVSIALLRMLPVAPYSVVNLAVGSIGVQFGQYIVGTALGMLPGILAISFFGQQLREALASPTPARIGIAVLALAAWIGLCLGLQRLLKRRKPIGTTVAAEEGSNTR